MYHEPVEELSAETRNIVRALDSLKEEVEAINWYHQRVDACKDAELKKILEHNRDEEIEHAVMTIEWLRRNMSGWDEELRTYIFGKGDITALEEGEEEGEEKTHSDLGLNR
ncbi:MAG: ferritin-like domain-containing protein [Candidatus Cloacimonadota bacterium]|nr:ferritin-like domain-containing protein [Candidatus Cloacimonadota bacterium]